MMGLDIRPTWRSLIGIMLLVAELGILIPACLPNNSGARIPARGYTSLPTETPIPIGPLNLPLAGGATSHSVLIMVQGMVEHRLVIWPLSGTGQPLQIDRAVRLFPLLPDPTQTRVLYATSSALLVFDVEARRSTIVAEISPKGDIGLAQWSPDGQSIAYVLTENGLSTAYYTSADGLRTAEPMLSVRDELPLDVAWLNDSRPMVIFMGVGKVGGLEANYRVYDPVTKDLTPLPADTPFAQPWEPWRSPDRQMQVYPASAWDKTRHGGTCHTGPMELAGPEWIFLRTQGGAMKESFRVRNVYLDRATWLRDGRIIFRGMADEACQPGGSGLYLAAVDQEPVQIVESEAYYAPDDPDGMLWGVSYALSPDQSVVAWANNDLRHERGTIVLTPLDGGSNDILYQTPYLPVDSNPFAFEDTQMILAFLWLP